MTNAWTAKQIELLKAHPGMRMSELLPLINAVGPGRTPNAIDSKRSSLRVKGRQTPGLPPEYARKTGWPVTPPEEIADDLFVRAVALAMRAEGLIRSGRAA